MYEMVNRRWIYIYIKGDHGGRPSGPSQVLPGLCNRQIMTMIGKLADTIYIICWSVDEPTLFDIFSKSLFVNIE